MSHGEQLNSGAREPVPLGPDIVRAQAQRQERLARLQDEHLRAEEALASAQQRMRVIEARVAELETDIAMIGYVNDGGIWSLEDRRERLALEENLATARAEIGEARISEANARQVLLDAQRKIDALSGGASTLLEFRRRG